MDRIRRLAIAIGLTLTLGLLMVSTTLAGKPGLTPPYATISIKTNCAMTFVGGYTGPFGIAYGLLYQDGLFDLTVDTYTGLNPGTIDTSKNTVTWTSVKFAKTAVAHTYSVIVQFYSAAGAYLDEVQSNTVSAKCG